MAKIVRLTESDLTRIVRRVIKEQELDRELPRKKRGILGHKDNWYDEMDRPVNPDEFDYDEEIEFGPDDFEDYIAHTETDFPDTRWDFNAKGHKGDRGPGKHYFDKYTKDGPVKLRKKSMHEQEEKKDGIVEMSHRMIMLDGASSETVSRVLENLPEGLQFLTIKNSEFADFSSVDVCGLRRLQFINLRGTDNNLEEYVDCDVKHVGHNMFDFNVD